MVILSSVFSKLRGDFLAEAQGGAAQVGRCACRFHGRLRLAPQARMEWQAPLLLLSCAYTSSSKPKPLPLWLAGLQATHQQVSC